MTNPHAIVTMPPYAPFMEEVLAHPIVSGIRLNTVMPITGSLEDVLEDMHTKAKKYGKDLWIDLKGRQLRVASHGVPPFTEIELTHNIEVKTPVKAYFSDGKEVATVLKVDKNRLIMQEGPKRVVGPGESVNIPDDSLSIDGYLTDLDKQYVQAAKNVDVHNYMLSFVEKKEDVLELYRQDSKARVYSKIESKKGLEYAATRSGHKDRLIAARGDLYLEVGMPHKIEVALEQIIHQDNYAAVASRIFNSLTESLEPSCEDIGDVNNLLRMGYRTFMFGDHICMRRDSIMSGLNLFAAVSAKYRKKSSKGHRSKETSPLHKQ